jgi:hypothetical protein
MLLATVDSAVTGTLSGVTSAAAPLLGSASGVLHAGSGAGVHATGGTAGVSATAPAATVTAPAPTVVVPALPPVSSLTGALDGAVSSVTGAAPALGGSCLPLLGCLGG